ncbi:MAG: hypothetical protein NTY77_11885 [Elusimicrobia bacterium]|nr:hypothetical protein [Elusimicrobiota bacterium]
MKNAGWFLSGACLILAAQSAAAAEPKAGPFPVDLIASIPAGSLLDSSRCGAPLDLQFCVEPQLAGPRLVLRLGSDDARFQGAAGRLARLGGMFIGSRDIAVFGGFHLRLDLVLR